jgi:hypothetical protein
MFDVTNLGIDSNRFDILRGTDPDENPTYRESKEQEKADPGEDEDGNAGARVKTIDSAPEIAPVQARYRSSFDKRHTCGQCTHLISFPCKSPETLTQESFRKCRMKGLGRYPMQSICEDYSATEGTC